MDHPDHPRSSQPAERLYGGFVPGLPPGLESPRQQLGELQRSGSPHESASVRIELLQKALAQVQELEEPEITLKTRAALQGALAVAYQQRLDGDRVQQMEAALVACEEALQVSTLAHSPYQYASVQVTLGNVYRERVLGAQRDNLERSITCFRTALSVFTLAAFPYEYALAHYGLGQTYQLRIEGERQDNLEQAILCCYAALDIYT